MFILGVKEWNEIDGHFLQVTNYCDYLEDVASSSLSDDDFTQEECEELNQRMKNGSVKRLTVVDMEEKVRSLHEDVTKHWIARELLLLKWKINQASEKGWKREYPFSFKALLIVLFMYIFMVRLFFYLFVVLTS